MRSVRQSSPLVGLAVAAASVAAITGLNYALREVAPAVSTGVVYLLAVLLVSTYWGVWLGLVTGILSAAAFNYFHIPPTGKFSIDSAENWVALSTFVVAAIVTSTLANAARTRAREAERRRAEADLAAGMARQLLGGASIEESLDAVGRGISEAFGLDDVSVQLGWLDSDQRRKALPLIVGGERIGTMLVPRQTDAALLDALQDRVVPGLETLVEAARKREELEAQVVETKALRRSNVVQRALLRSVSHDLRTPLTAITAAAGGLASANLSPEARAELVSVVSAESARLARLVDNLLDLSRIQAGGAEPRRDWCPVEEVVRAAIESVPEAPGGFDVELDEGLPMLNVDAAQLERALANVLENSARLGGDQPVAVRALVSGSTLTLRVSDRGPGIPKADLERVFEPFHSGAEQRDGGSGLGLAIARGFIEANGGRLRAESLPGQGTSFVFQLPIPADGQSA